MNAHTRFHVDSETDVSDEWAEMTDPENERGDIATALFEHGSAEAFHPSDPRERGEIVSVPVLVALRIENGGQIIYPREWVLNTFGPKWVSAIEDARYEAVNT